MRNELRNFKKEREKNIKNGKPADTCKYFCQRCGNISIERVPKSEGWQPFSLVPCKFCGSEFGSFLGYLAEIR